MNITYANSFLMINGVLADGWLDFGTTLALGGREGGGLQDQNKNQVNVLGHSCQPIVRLSTLTMDWSVF